MQVDVKIDSTVDEMKILVIADKEGHTVDTFVDYIRDYERKQVTKLMAYKGDTAYLINISDILRIMREIKKCLLKRSRMNILSDIGCMNWKNYWKRKHFLESPIRKLSIRIRF